MARPGTPALNRAYSYDSDGLRADLLWDTSTALPLVLADAPALYVTGAGGMALEELRLDGTRRFYHQDQLGSTRALTDTAGAVTSRHQFDAYGNPVSPSGTEKAPFGFAGQYTDAQTGLVYTRARWYDPKTGQFITVDPIGPASGETNLYRYAGGDPINNADPSGLLSLPSPTEAANSFVGALDGATFGVTRSAREFLYPKVGAVDGVDYCSDEYRISSKAGRAAPVIAISTGVGLYGRGVDRRIRRNERVCRMGRERDDRRRNADGAERRLAPTQGGRFQHRAWAGVGGLAGSIAETGVDSYVMMSVPLNVRGGGSVVTEVLANQGLGYPVGLSSYSGIGGGN